MPPSRRLPNAERRKSILSAVRPVFAEKGLNGVTTRELAKAAGISEGLLFRHFPNKEALYHEVQMSVMMAEMSAMDAALDALPDCTETLVYLLREIFTQFVMGFHPPNGNPGVEIKILFGNLIDGNEFARRAMNGKPRKDVGKIARCLEVAQRSGDALPGPYTPEQVCWLSQHMGAMLGLHFVPNPPLVDYGAKKDDLILIALWFSLRGMGVKDDAILRCLASLPALRLSEGNDKEILFSPQ